MLRHPSPRSAAQRRLHSRSAPARSAEPLKVVASFSIIGDFAKNVGGDRIELTTLVGPDGDAHVYEPKPADAVAMAGADVVLVNGLHFEGFLQRLVEASATKAPIVELTKGVETIAMAEEEHARRRGSEPRRGGHHHHGDIDPHAFQSVANAEIYVKNIADAFCAADAAGCDDLPGQRRCLHRQARGAGRRGQGGGRRRSRPTSAPIITSHDAFGYFEHAYGITLPGAGRHLDRSGSLGRRRRRADQPGPGRQGVGDLRRKHHQPAPDRADRRRDRPQGRRHALIPTRCRTKAARPRPIST